MDKVMMDVERACTHELKDELAQWKSLYCELRDLLNNTRKDGKRAKDTENQSTVCVN